MTLEIIMICECVCVKKIDLLEICPERTSAYMPSTDSSNSSSYLLRVHKCSTTFYSVSKCENNIINIELYLVVI